MESTLPHRRLRFRAPTARADAAHDRVKRCEIVHAERWRGHGLRSHVEEQRLSALLGFDHICLDLTAPSRSRFQRLQWQIAVHSRHGLPLIRAPQLKRPIGYPETARSALDISGFLLGCKSNCDILGGAANLLESRAKEDRALDLSFEIRIQPSCVCR